MFISTITEQLTKGTGMFAKCTRAQRHTYFDWVVSTHAAQVLYRRGSLHTSFDTNIPEYIWQIYPDYFMLVGPLGDVYICIILPGEQLLVCCRTQRGASGD